jgi:PIN domain nuclease of toxin-antitoxin system
MLPRLLLDTHIVVRWLVDSKRLSTDQGRVLEGAVRRAEPVALSAISLLEIAILKSQGRLRLKVRLEELFNELQSNVAFRLLPLTHEIASEIALPGSLRDPADRAIVATARVHRLRLVTSDQRITASRLVAVVE